MIEGVQLREGETRRLLVELEPADVQINPLTITASRRPEKLLDAPASITTLEARDIEPRVAFTAAEHLKSIPSVELISTGLTQSRLAVRGFNDNLSSAVLTMVDNRIARVPSIRLTALQLIPVWQRRHRPDRGRGRTCLGLVWA